MTPDTVGMVWHAQHVTVQLPREIAWVLGIVVCIGLGTCIATVQEVWQQVVQRGRGPQIRRVL